MKLITEGIRVLERHRHVRFLFVAFLKILNNIIGSVAPCSSFRCPWCLVPKKHIGSLTHTLLTRFRIIDLYLLPPRPQIQELRRYLSNGKIQKADTFNLFGANLATDVTLVVPSLLVTFLGRRI